MHDLIREGGRLLLIIKERHLLYFDHGRYSLEEAAFMERKLRAEYPYVMDFVKTN